VLGQRNGPRFRSDRWLGRRGTRPLPSVAILLRVLSGALTLSACATSQPRLQVANIWPPPGVDAAEVKWEEDFCLRHSREWGEHADLVYIGCMGGFHFTLRLADGRILAPSSQPSTVLQGQANSLSPRSPSYESSPHSSDGQTSLPEAAVPAASSRTLRWSSLTPEQKALAEKVVVKCIAYWAIYKRREGATSVVERCTEAAKEEAVIYIVKSYVCGNQAVLTRLENVDPLLKDGAEAVLECT
jgi:hypothetical protein